MPQLDEAFRTISDELRTMALASQSWITAWRGDLPEALRLGEQAMASAVTGWYTAVAYAMCAQARIYAGQLDGTVDRVAPGGVPLCADVRGLAENELEDRAGRVAHVGLEAPDAAEERTRDDPAVVPDDRFDRRVHA